MKQKTLTNGFLKV